MPQAECIIGFNVWEKLEKLNINEHRVPLSLKVIDIQRDQTIDMS
jgi:hypothetical protein